MNMNYCRFQNTLIALRDCQGALEDVFNGQEKLSTEEQSAAVALIDTCQDIVFLLKDTLALDCTDEITRDEVKTLIKKLSDSD